MAKTLKSTTAFRRGLSRDRQALWTHPGQLGLMLLSLLPVAFWLTAVPLSIRFSDAVTSLTSVAVICALIGTSLFAFNLVLGARLKVVAKLFGGLDKMFPLHRLNGRVAFVLLLLHAGLILAVRFTGSIQNGGPLFVSSEMWTIVFGVVALILITITIALTLYGKLVHEVFLYVHRIFGFAFLLAALHVFRTPGTKSVSAPLTYYLAAVSIAGIGAFVYRSIAGEALVPRLDYRVKTVNRLDQSVTEIHMAPEDQVLNYIPGQFLFVTFYSEAIQQEFHPVSMTSEGASAVVHIRPGAMGHQAHPFSITTRPSDPDLKIAVKALGDFTRAVQVLEPGTAARIEGPFGSFSYLKVKNNKQIWIAGGIGVTPFLSMARSLESDDYEIDFFYAMERGDQGYFLDELYEIADRHPRFRVTPIKRDTLGHITADDIEGVSSKLPEKDILISGPPPMIESLSRQFQKKGVPKSQIHFEKFSFTGK